MERLRAVYVSCAPWLADDTKRRRLEVYAACLGLFVVALWLRLHAIDRESIWLDEAYTYKRATLPLSKTISESIARYHNPSYFLFMHYFIALGDDELWLRLPSAISGALTACVVCLIGKTVTRLRAGIVAGALVALAPEQVYYGQEARMYAMLGLSASLVMLGLTWLAMHRSQACRPILGARRFWPRAPRPSRAAQLAWALCIIGTIGTLHLHNTGVVFVTAAGVAVLCLYASCGARKNIFLVNALLALACALATWLPYALSLVGQIERVERKFWEVFPTWPRFVKVLRQVYLMDARLWSAVGMLLLGFALLGAWKLRRRMHVALTLGLLAVLGTALLLLLSLRTPIFGARLLIWAPLPFFALVGVGVSRLRHLAWTVGFVAVIAALTAPRLAREYDRKLKERWRDVYAAMLPRVGEDTLIICATRQEFLPLRYYFGRKRHPLAPIPMVYDPDNHFGFDPALGGDRSEVLARIRAARHIFVIDRKRGNQSKELRSALVGRGRLLATLYWDKLRLDEIAIGRLPHLPKFRGGTGHVSEAQYKAVRREH